jgi:hypothetical protein
MTPPTCVTIGPSPLKLLGTAVITSIAITAGASILVVFVGFLTGPWLLSHAGIIIACTAALLACYWGIAMPVAITCGRPRVEIGPDGFDTHGILGHRWRRWSDIEGGFAVVRVGLQPTVAYRLTGPLKESARIQPIASLAGQGHDEAILFCGELAMGAGELAEVLNQWKQGVPSATSAPQPTGAKAAPGPAADRGRDSSPSGHDGSSRGPGG